MVVRNCLNSFILKKPFWYSLGLDSLFVFFMAVLYAQLLAWSKRTLISLTGSNPEFLQQRMLKMAPEQIVHLGQDLQAFLAFFMLGILVLLAVSLLLFSLAQALEWNYLLKKRLSQNWYWRWNALHLILVMPIVGYLVLMAFSQFLFTGLLGLFIREEQLLAFLSQFFIMFLLLFLSIIFFAVQLRFAQHYQAFQSMGRGILLITKKWKQLWPALLLMVAIALVLSVQYSYFVRFLALSELVLMGIKIFLSLLFIAWMRVYFVSIVHGTN